MSNANWGPVTHWLAAMPKAELHLLARGRGIGDRGYQILRQGGGADRL